MSSANVLVVEDDDAIRRLLIEYLHERCCVTVDGASDGAEALHRLTTQPYRVVVLDLMMPLMSGIDLLDSLEAMARDPLLRGPLERPAVVIITSTPAEALEDSHIRQRFPSLVKGVLRKPFDIAQLAGTVETLCGT